MSRLIPAADRIKKARVLIQQAYELPVPSESGRFDFSYISRVKALLQQARDLVKLIPYSPSTSPEMKEDVKKIFLEAEKANTEILHR